MHRAAKLSLILRLFTADKPLWTVEEAAGALGVSLSTAYRQFGAMVKAGLLDPVEGSRAYVLGPAIIEMDRNIRLSDPLIKVAKPAMRWLADQCPVPCIVLLCRLYGDRVMCIHQEEKPGLVGEVSYERGRPMPLSRGAPSKAILAQLPPRRLAALLSTVQAEDRNFDVDTFRHELQEARKQGYCITYGEVDHGIVGVATPLPAPHRGIVASLGVACFGSPDELNIIRVRALMAATCETIKGTLMLPAQRLSLGAASHTDAPPLQP